MMHGYFLMHKRLYTLVIPVLGRLKKRMVSEFGSFLGYIVRGQPELHSENLYHKTKQKHKIRNQKG
jgi:hypothetical protein